MHLRLTLAVLVMLATAACTSTAVTRPVIEPGIYDPAPPFVDIKQSFYVTEQERALLPRITQASDAIVLFLIDMHNARLESAAGIRQVNEGARTALRLPPRASAPVTGRYVDARVYCWNSANDDTLTFLIEWADVATKARYTDSYVFVRRGASWFFEKHGDVAPWRWTQTERYVQPSCGTHQD